MLSEYENNLIQHSATSDSSERKSRKSSIFRQIGQTLNGRYGHKSGLTESSLCHHPPNNANHNAAHGNRHVSSTQRAGREQQHSEAASKMVQIHECNEAEGCVWVVIFFSVSAKCFNVEFIVCLRLWCCDLTHQPIPKSSEVNELHNCTHMYRCNAWSVYILMQSDIVIVLEHINIKKTRCKRIPSVIRL